MLDLVVEKTKRSEIRNEKTCLTEEEELQMIETHFVLGNLSPLSFVDTGLKVKGFRSFAFWYF